MIAGKPFSRRPVRARRASSAASPPPPPRLRLRRQFLGRFSSSIGEGARSLGAPASKSESSVASGTPAPLFSLSDSSQPPRRGTPRVRTWLPKSRRPGLAGDVQDVAVGGERRRAPPRDPDGVGAERRQELEVGKRPTLHRTVAGTGVQGTAVGREDGARHRREVPPFSFSLEDFRSAHGRAEEGEPDGDSAASSPSVFASPATVWVRPSFPSPPATSARACLGPASASLRPAPRLGSASASAREGTFRTYLPRRYRCRCPSTSARARAWAPRVARWMTPTGWARGRPRGGARQPPRRTRLASLPPSAACAHTAMHETEPRPTSTRPRRSPSSDRGAGVRRRLPDGRAAVPRGYRRRRGSTLARVLLVGCEESVPGPHRAAPQHAPQHDHFSSRRGRIP